MAKIGTPLQIPELYLTPEPEGAIDLSKDMQQTLALLTGFWQNQRVLLKSSPTGILHTSSARLADVVHFTGAGANDTQQGEDVPCTECLCMGHPDNTGTVWVRPDVEATTDNAWPLKASEAVSIAVHNLKQLQMLIVVDGEKLIVAHTI